jgi:hypothetical protein
VLNCKVFKSEYSIQTLLLVLAFVLVTLWYCLRLVKLAVVEY